MKKSSFFRTNGSVRTCKLSLNYIFLVGLRFLIQNLKTHYSLQQQHSTFVKYESANSVNTVGKFDFIDRCAA